MTVLSLTHPATPRRVRTIPVDNIDVELAFFESVPAGFPSPADDYSEGKLNLNDYLVKDSACTFFVRVTGTSMVGAGIYPDDILVVDKSLTAKHDDVVIAYVNREFTVKRLYKVGKTIRLLAENPAFSPIHITEGDELIIWGVVSHVLHKPVKL